MRVESNRSLKNGGWLHYSDQIPKFIPKKKIEEPTEKIDFYGMWKGWRRTTKSLELIPFGESLGIHPQALWLIGCVWAEPHNAFAFPMYNGEGNMCGIRLRSGVGKKWAILGSKQGVFLSSEDMNKVQYPGITYVLEGPTDTAAAISLGLPCIGRPSCLGCYETIQTTLDRNKLNRTVIVSDNDSAGRNGAIKLQEALDVKTCILTPPAKDFREFLKLGGTVSVIESMLKDLIWN